ncbi:potassium transporter [Lysinibacillus sp. NPDC048646]|uniref:potassium transporter n=1 Tax=Lysinibacillus sp. NPDC048646 TaxID=3390574 RepID=UPI003D06DF3C
MTSNKNSAILLLTALVAAILFALHYYILTPKLDQVEAKQNAISSLQQEVATIQEQVAVLESEQVPHGTSVLALRKKVPQTRAIEEVIRHIEEIEAVTGTRVESVDFNNYDSLVIDSTISDPNSPTPEEQVDTEQPATETGEQSNTEKSEEAENQLPSSTIAKESLPAELKLVTFSIDVAAIDAKAMLEFLKEIEKIERVMKIDALDFSLTGEEEKFQEDADSTITATVQVTTFYYEGQQ